MVMRPPPPVRGWEPWRRRRFRAWLKAHRLRRSCRKGHIPRKGRFREINSRSYVQLTVCARCEALLDAEGRRNA